MALAQWFDLEVFLSKRSLIDPASGIDVSVASHGDRLRFVHRSLVSIGNGRLRPASLTLAVADSGFLTDPSPSVLRLMDRGLRLTHVEDHGPHARYFAAVRSVPGHRPLVLADDDRLHSRAWLDDLARVGRSHPNEVVAHAARHLVVRQGAAIASAAWWPTRCAEASFQHVATSAAGVMYPARMREVMRMAGSEFDGPVREAVDVWLHLLAVREGIRTRQVRRHPRRPLIVSGGSSRSDRAAAAVDDAAVLAAYTQRDLARIAGDVCGCVDRARHVSTL